MNDSEYKGYHLQNLTVNRKKACTTYESKFTDQTLLG